MDSDLKLQMIEDDANGAYIIFESEGDIEADIEPDDNVVNLLLNEARSQNDETTRHVYHLTTKPKHDTIKVLVDGKETSFDRIVAG